MILHQISVITPIIMERLQSVHWFVRNQRILNVPLQSALTFVLFGAMVPVGCALFPQRKLALITFFITVITDAGFFRSESNCKLLTSNYVSFGVTGICVCQSFTCADIVFHGDIENKVLDFSFKSSVFLPNEKSSVSM